MKTEYLERYPKEVQEVIKSVKPMTRKDIIEYFDDKIKYYEQYNKNNPNMSWAKEYPRNYAEKKEEVLRAFDENGVACYHTDYNHYGYGFDCEDIDVYLYIQMVHTKYLSILIQLINLLRR